MSESIVIEVAEAGDRDGVIALLADQLAEHRIHTARDAIAAAIDGIMADDRRGFVLVVRENCAVIGVAYVSFAWTLEHGGKSCWLEELYVVPSRRGHGFGTKLLASVLQRAGSCGCVAVDLEVDAEHSRAARLYSRSGFHSLDRRRWVRIL